MEKLPLPLIRYFLAVLFAIIVIDCHSQPGFGNRQDNIRWKDQLYFGLTIDQFYFTKKEVNGYRFETAFKRYWLCVLPRVGYYLTRDLAIGPSMRWSVVKSNFAKRKPAYGLGAFVRYDLGFINRPLAPSWTTINLLGKERDVKFRFYVRLTYQRTNEIADEDMRYRVTNQFDNHVLIPSTGLDISFFEHLYLGMDIRRAFFFPKRDFPTDDDYDLNYQPDLFFPAINLTYDL